MYMLEHLSSVKRLQEVEILSTDQGSTPHGLLLSNMPVSNSHEQPIPEARTDETQLTYIATVALSLTQEEYIRVFHQYSTGRFYLCTSIPVNPSAHFSSTHLIVLPMCITSCWKIINIQETEAGWDQSNLFIHLFIYFKF